MLSVRKHKTIAALALGLALAGCGGSKDAAKPQTQVTTPTATPTYVESDTCRTELRPLVDVLLANETDTVGLTQIKERFSRLQRQADDALTTCSDAITAPVRKAIYELSIANTYATFCLNGTTCTQGNKDTMAKAIRAANKSADTADALLDKEAS